MALTVEDGSVVSGAESYLSVADADTYFTNHGSPSDWTGATTAAKEAALRYATRWLDQNFTWKSNIYSTSQVLDWPRIAFYDDDDRTIGGVNNMPQELLDATAEMALAHIQESLVEPGNNIYRERVGSAEVVYNGAGGSKKSYHFVSRMLHRLGRPSTSQVTLKRG